jgi:plasmid stabilization system protein ParE
MTRYTVSWRPETKADLAEIWMNSTDRRLISAAANRIDELLSRDATSQGNDVHEGLRALAVDPLLVYFTVSEADRLATVWSVRPSRM